MYDNNITLQAATVMTGAPVTGTAFNTLTGTRGGLRCVVEFLVTTATATGAGAVWTPKVQVSADNTTWNDWAIGLPITSTTTNTPTKFNIPIRTDPANPWIRPVVTISPTTGTPVFAYSARFGVSWP